MTRFNLYLVMGLLVGAMLASLIADDAGYVLLRWRGWQLETSVWLAMGLGVLLALIFALLREFLRSTLRIPSRLRHWLGLRSVRGAQRQTDKGLAAFFEGRWDVAERALRKVQVSERRTVLHPLYAAIAAGRKGDHDRAQLVLSSAESAAETPGHLVLMARAECQMAMGNFDQARQVLGGLSSDAQVLPQAKKLRAQLAYAQKAWMELISLTSDLHGRHLVPEALINLWEREAYQALLSDNDCPSAELLKLWRQAPPGLTERGSELWAALCRTLTARSEWESLCKVMTERLGSHCEAASCDAVQALPHRQAVKLQKAIRQWVDKDLDGRCHAALAHIAEQDGRSEEAGELWQQAYALGKLPSSAAGWCRWLREQGDDHRATTIEREVLASLALHQPLHAGGSATAD